MAKEKKTYRELERIARGFSNHRRIQIMELLHKKPELSVDEIANEINVNFKTISEHIRRLSISAIVLKHPDGHSVLHNISTG